MSKILPVIVAAAGGFLAGILLAPKSGEETRRDIADKATEYKGKANEGLKEVKKGAAVLKDELADGVESVKDIARDAADEASRTASRVRGVVTEKADTVKKEVSATSDDVKRAAR